MMTDPIPVVTAVEVLHDFVLGVTFDSKGRLWFATRAGVGCRQAEGWKFYEGKNGLPWNDFTGIAAGPEAEVWFGTRLGAAETAICV